MRTGSMAIFRTNRLFGRVIWITVVFPYAFCRTRKRIRVVLATTVAAAAATVVLLVALGGCMEFVGPTDRVRFGGGILQVREPFHPAGKRATTAIAVYPV